MALREGAGHCCGGSTWQNRGGLEIFLSCKKLGKANKAGICCSDAPLLNDTIVSSLFLSISRFP